MKIMHSSTAMNHPKIKILLEKYGMEGYGLFWIVCEGIARLSVIDRKSIIATCSVSPARLDEFLDFLMSPEIGIIQNDNGQFRLNPDTGIFLLEN
jgi:hypothetical protein